MISRREFFGLAALGTVGAIITGCSTTVKENVLPPSIASLKSMKDRVVPISVDERKQRIERAKKLMGAHKIDAIVVMGGSTLNYFTGISWGTSERMLALVIPRNKQPFIVCPFFEKTRAMEQIEGGPLDDLNMIITWQEHESPYKKLVGGLKDVGISSGRIGIEETVRFVFSDGINNATNSFDIVSATPVTAGCRGIKDAHEIELMRIASEATFKAYKAAYEAVEVGMTQGEFSQLIAQAHSRLGFRGYASVQVGKYAALPHGSRTPQKIMENEVVLIDGGCQVEGYWSDLSRTFVLGTPNQKTKDAFDIVLEAQTKALEVARPGIEAQELDAAARKVITDAGYGPDYKYFTHRLGHGMGLDMHEWPYLVKGNTTILEPGMTFSDEPGIYVPDEFGIRLEDDLLITESGAELLTSQSPSLTDPFGPARNR